MLSKLRQKIFLPRTGSGRHAAASQNDPIPEQTAYQYNANDDGMDEFNRCFTSRNGDGSGDPEEDFLSCLNLVAQCKSGLEFLDIGSGFGRIIEIIRHGAGHVTGLEPDAGRFDYCRNRFAAIGNVAVHNSVTSAYRVEHPGKKFDLITFSMVLQHISIRQSRAVLADVADLLAPGGLAIIGTTHFCAERLTYQNRFVPASVDEFEAYAENTAAQEWGIPVRMFSKESFLAAVHAAALAPVLWRQFCYLRPAFIETFAKRYDVPPEAICDTGSSQFAVVRKASPAS